MKRLLPGTMFGRLFTLMVAAILISHLITFCFLVGMLGYGADIPPPPKDDFYAQRRGIPFEGAPLPPGAGEFSSGRREPPPDMQPPPWDVEPMFWVGDHAILPPPKGLWQGFLIQISILTIAAWFGAKALVRPVQRLAQAATRLGENLNTPPMDEAGPAEARQAAQIFNRMQKRLQSHIEERARFLAAVSHDLRTPLTRMKLRVERLPDESSAEKLRGDIDEMAAMLNATLEYFRGTEADRSRQVLDVHALIDSMVEDARDAGHDVSLSGAARPLLTSPMALRRCLSNLLDNALRYGEKAEIVLDDSSDKLLIEVRDKGPGIPEDMMEKVLEPFVRLDPSRNKASGGFGLGLSIAREAADQCGGTLSLHNAVRGGLIARVVLPRQA